MNTDAVFEKLDGLSGAAEEELRQRAEACLEKCRAAAPVQTGRLRSSIELGGSGEVLTVGTDCPYAAAVHYGGMGRAAQPFMTL